MSGLPKFAGAVQDNVRLAVVLEAARGAAGAAGGSSKSVTVTVTAALADSPCSSAAVTVTA